MGKDGTPHLSPGYPSGSAVASAALSSWSNSTGVGLDSMPHGWISEHRTAAEQTPLHAFGLSHFLVARKQSGPPD